MRRFTVLIGATASLLSCAPSDRALAPDLLYVWAFDTNREASDFLTVIDADREASTYGAILDTLPVGLVGGAHHTEHRMPDGNILFANAFPAGTTFLFDVTRPRAPGVASSFVERGAYTFLHSSERLPNGNVLATFQNRGDGNLEPGGLVELDPQGRYLRGADAADPDVDPHIRPYSLAILPEIDRVISTTADMRGKLLPTSVQLWQLSELQLLKTVLLPPGERGNENLMPAEPRVLQDGRSVVVNTFSCGLYLLTELETAEPVAIHLRTFPYEPPHRCALAARIGDFWVQTVPTSEALVSLDLSDPSAPRLVQELKLGENYRPHWMAADRSGHRIVVTGRGDMEHRVLLVRFDPESGQMELDTDFRDEGSQVPGVSFDRATLPHGDTGTATPLVRKEAVLSSQIEGTQSSLSDLLLLLSEERVLGEPLLYLSLYFKRYRQTYYDLLQRIRTDGMWEDGVDFFVTGIRETAQSAVSSARRISELFQENRQRIQGLGRSAGSALRVLDQLERRPLTTIKRIADASNLSIPAATTAVRALEDLEIARELTGKKRDRLYAYSSYLAILNEGVEDTTES